MLSLHFYHDSNAVEKKCDFVSYFVDTASIVCNCMYEYMQWVSKIDFSFNCFRDIFNVTISTCILFVICADYKEQTAVLVSSGILHIIYVYVCILLSDTCNHWEKIDICIIWSI